MKSFASVFTYFAFINSFIALFTTSR